MPRLESKRLGKRRRTGPITRSRSTALRRQRTQSLGRVQIRSRLSGLALPTVYVARHVYSTWIELNARTTSGITTVSIKRFRANNVYDPDYSGVGGQPRGRDELSVHYNKYVVLQSRIDATPIYQGTTPVVKGYTGIKTHRYILDTNDPLQMNNANKKAADFIENGMKMNKSIYLTQSNAHGANQGRHTIKSYFSGTRAFGKGWTKEPDYWMKIDEAEATTAMNPDVKKNYYFSVWAMNDPAQGDDHNVTVKYRVNVTYIVKWFDRKALVAS